MRTWEGCEPFFVVAGIGAMIALVTLLLESADDYQQPAEVDVVAVAHEACAVVCDGRPAVVERMRTLFAGWPAYEVEVRCACLVLEVP